MRKIVKMISIILIATMVIGIANLSNAFSFDASLSSNDKLVAGQEVKITLSLSSIDMDDGIRSIKVGKITIGEEFEPIATTSFSSDTWMPTYSNGGLVLMSGTPVKTEGIAVTLTLKVKEGITANSSTIKFDNIVASSGSNTGDIAVETKSITITADKPTTDENGDETTNSGTTGNIQEENKQATEQNVDNTPKGETSSKMAPNKLPKTGSTENVVIIALILIVTGVGIVFFAKYKKYDNK